MRSTTPNEVVLLDSRLEQAREETHPNSSQDEFFLISSIDTLLRGRALSYQQIEDGIVEGADDGGIDAVYVFYNGNLVEDDTEIGGSLDPHIELEVIQAKNEKGFKETALQRLIDHLPLLVQLDIPPGLESEFNDKVLERFSIFRATYLGASSKFPRLTVHVRYVTKSVEQVNEKVEKKGARLSDSIESSFGDASIHVSFVGAGDLNSCARERVTDVLELNVSEGPISAEKGGSICLVSLFDYYTFVTDDSGRLRDEIFEENVRGYEGATVINKAIGSSLKEGDDSSVDFWWLNNGVTVLGRRVQSSRKKLVIDDPQIVNGLQTSRNIFHYFHSIEGGDFSRGEGGSRHVLVRVIEAEDDKVSAQIIKATNSQNRVSAASLRATEPFQRDIEEYFAKCGLYYERKKNQYKDQGKPRESIVEVLELAQAVASVVLFEPHTARANPSTLIRDGQYDKVFSKKSPLETYVKCIRVMRKIDSYLEAEHPSMTRSQRSNFRFHLARAATSFALSSFHPRPQAIANMHPEWLDSERLNLVFNWVIAARDRISDKASDMNVLAKGAEWAREMDRQFRTYSDKSRWPKKIVE